MTQNEIFSLLKEAMEKSYSPYSKFKVGALLLTKDNQVFLGTNIENAAYGLCMCAERVCIYNAFMQGIKKDDVELFALIGDTEKPISPCGSCRQVMSELLPSDVDVYMFNLKGELKIVKNNTLLPFAFDDKDL